MMKTLDPTESVGQLVTGNPARTRGLEAVGIDYCCGGRRSLAEACAEVGADVEAVLASLAAIDTERAGTRPDWADLGPAALASHIQATHHTYLWDELPRLDALATKVEAAHGSRHPELADVAATYRRLRAELEPHLAREEEVVFPACRRLVPGVVDDVLADAVLTLEDEHDVAGDLLDDLRRLTAGFIPPADGCGSSTALYAGLAQLDTDTRLHVHKENNLLFPMLTGGRPSVPAVAAG